MEGIVHKKVEAGKIFSNSPFTTGKNPAILYERQENAPVVQWIERQIPVLNVGGSSPSGRAKKKDTLCVSFFLGTRAVQRTA